jgi:hypothetical protein
MDTWFGYVHHHMVVSEPSADTIVVEYALIGTSRSMDFLADRRWTSVSASSVVRDIAAARGFRTVISKSSLVLPYVATGTSTDFQLLKDMADRTGYRIATRNSTIHFIDPRHRIIGNDTGRVFSFVQDKTGAAGDTLGSFRILSGSDIPGMQNRQSIYSGVNHETRAVVTATGAPGDRATVRKTGYVDSVGLAQHAAQSDDLRNRFWLTAEIVVDGSSRMDLGDLVSLSGSALPVAYQGPWAIRSVSRRYLRGSSRLVSTVVLERNYVDSLTYDKTITLPNRTANDAIALRSGQWVAKIREDLTVG